ncbi:MAG TPA: alpha/beta hydrolase [Ferruginibacter sp.]|nr:alpha/beta hydrolase [Ferruginibacter sp.]
METNTKATVGGVKPEGLQQSATHVRSKDGTRIVFSKTGAGPAIIIVNGALSYRAVYDDSSLMSALSKTFTIYTYDRRGRGESSDTRPYHVDREIEDLEALIEDAGGSARIYGSSSGAALSLLAAARLGKAKVPQLVLYEPPYVSVSEKDKQHFTEQGKRIVELVSKGNRGDAISFHFAAIGTPPEALEKLRRSPEWPLMESVEPTLAYDYAILDDGAIPVDAAKKIAMPALVMSGEKSVDVMGEAAKKLAGIMPDAQWKTLKGQAHQPSPEILATALKEFFKQD